MTWPKVCPCCGESYTRDQWLLLPCLGIHPGFEELPDLEMRNCGCHASLTVPLAGGEIPPEDGGPFDHESDVREPSERLAS